MSIQSEITRISGNVSDALTAISNKGVTVPSDSNSDDLADLIGQITGGGASATTVVTTQDSHGGDIVTITTGIDISSDTVAADKLLYGYTAHDSTGTAITGSYTPPSPSLQAKTNIDPTESSQTIQADIGYDGLSSVQINAISSSYIGSGVTQRSSSDLTASGATVTAPAGYYAEAATKTISSGSATTPATTITANPLISVDSSTGVITADITKAQSVTPTVSAGYVSSGTAGTITVTGTKTYSLSTEQIQTYHPSTSDQTIASGTYLTGAQTFKAVTHNISASDIKKDVVVKIGDSTDDDCVASITGTYEGGGSAAQTKTGTFTGTGSISVSITGVNFAPDLIHIYGDLTGSTSYRGVSTLVIIRDTCVLQTNDSSTSSTSESLYTSTHGIAGLNESSTSVTHASYSGTTLTITTVNNTTANRFNSSITYSYKLVKWTS